MTDDISSFLLDPTTFISFLFVWGSVFLPVIAIEGGLASRTIEHIKNLAIPVGLAGSLIGTTALLDGQMTIIQDDSISNVYAGIAAMMLTMIFGGFLAATAYFWEQKNPPVKNRSVKKLSRFRTILALFFGFAPILLLIQQQRPLDAWLSPTPLVLTVLLLGLAWFVSKKSNRYELLSNACLCSAIIGLLMGVTLVFIGDLQQGLSIASNSLNYGLLVYIAIYITAATQRL